MQMAVRNANFYILNKYKPIFISNIIFFPVMNTLDPIYTGLVTMVLVLYLLEICCGG